jgi:hypothetical protein
MNYFKNCETETDVKNIYRLLFIQHSKDAAMMAEINSELKAILAAIRAFDEQASQLPAAAPETPAAAAPDTPAATLAAIEDAAKFARALPNVTTVEICGSWVWASGEKLKTDAETRGKLKAYGFKFCARKSNWYYHTGKFRRGNKSMNMTQIRVKYGNEATEQQLPYYQSNN